MCLTAPKQLNNLWPDVYIRECPISKTTYTATGGFASWEGVLFLWSEVQTTENKLIGNQSPLHSRCPTRLLLVQYLSTIASRAPVALQVASKTLEVAHGLEGGDPLAPVNRTWPLDETGLADDEWILDALIQAL